MEGPIEEPSSQTKKEGLEVGSENATGEKHMNSTNVEMLKEGTVAFEDVQMVLQLTSTSLKLQSATDLPVNTTKTQSDKAIEIPWQYVITAEITTRDVQKMNFTIHYIRQQEKKLQQQSIHLTTLDEPADSFIKVIQERCTNVEGRPKKLFVLVNPIGGAGKGVQIYHKQVAPVFQLANINVDVVFTDHPRQAREMGENQDFSSYDGVVLVGGDGTYQEIMEGMTLKMQTSAGVDYNDMNEKLVCLNKPIGIIPTGTGNTASYWTNGIYDVETATLGVLLGETQRSQIFTVHSNGKFICLGGVLFGCGMIPECGMLTQKLRWMRKLRYLVGVGYYCLKGGKRCNYILEYCTAPDNGSVENDKAAESSNQEASAGCRWIKHESNGRPYIGVFGLIGNPVKRGDHYVADFASNRIRLSVDLGCNTKMTFKWLLDGTPLQFPENPPQNMDVIDNVQRVRIKLNGQEGQKEETANEKNRDYYVCTDGETIKLEAPELDMRIIPSFVPLYSRKLE